MRYPLQLRRALIALPLVVLALPAQSQDSEGIVKRYLALVQKIESGTGPPRQQSKSGSPTAYEQLEWYGLISLGVALNQVEGKTQTMLDNQNKLVGRLDAEVQKLGTSAGNSAKGETSLGKAGVGAYCQRAQKIMPVLGSLAVAIQQYSSSYAANVGMLPLGEGAESSRRLSVLANDFNNKLQQLLSDNRAMIKDLPQVAEGLAPSKAVQQTADAGKTAAAAAAELRSAASKLQDLGVELVPMVTRFVEGRAELQSELTTLKPLVTDGSRRSQLQTLEGRMLSIRKATRSASDWERQIRAAVDDGYGLAEKKLDAIRKLQDPASSELQACAGNKDLPILFNRARLDAHTTITAAQEQMEQAVGARAILIEKENKILDQAIRKFQETETEAAAKSKQAFANLQTLDRKSPAWREQEQQYDRLEALRKKARNGIEAIREQRNEYAKEQQGMKQTMAGAARDLAALMAKGP